jgi:hypothetical protein
MIENTSTTHRCIKHLEEVYRLNEHNPIVDAETERVFSDTKIILSPSRNRLGVNITEAQECVRR